MCYYNPSSMQDTWCHMNFIIDLTYCRILVANSGRALECGICRSEAQNLPSSLFYLQTPVLHTVTKTWTHHLQRQSHAKLNLYGFLVLFLWVEYYILVYFCPLTRKHINTVYWLILRKMFFVLSQAWDKEKFWVPWGIEPQTFGFALRCSTTEPQRLFGEQGLLWNSNDTCPAYC